MIDRESFEESLIRPLQYWCKKSQSEVKSLLGSAVAQMVGFDQNNPHHCYDLFSHSLHTVQYLDKDSPALLRVSAFFHDVGKPFVAKEKQGHLVFYGHAQKSSEIAEPLLDELGYNTSEKELICFFINHHDDFISWVLSSEQYNHDNPYLIEISKENLVAHIRKTVNRQEFNVIQNTYELWDNLLSLCLADASAQAEYIHKNGIIVDSKEHKITKLKLMRELLSSAFT